MKINNVLREASVMLQNSCERPQFEAELLLAHHLDKARVWLMTHAEDEVEDVEGYMALVQRRAAYEPYEYIVGEASFYDIVLNVEPGVLIPRPETEILIDLTARIIEEEGIGRIGEIGVGSGAISIVLARKFPHLRIIATDICEVPLRVAGENAKKWEVSDRIDLRRSDLLMGVDEPLELVVSNPPYIAEDALLESNVVDHEPHTALFGGRRGDELLKRIITEVKERGTKWLACEMGYDQKTPIEAFVKEVGVQSIDFYKDLAGHDRGFVIRFI